MISPLLASNWGDFYCQQDAGDTWQCLHFKTNYCLKHATRAAAHFAIIPKIAIAICPAIIPAVDLTRYKNPFD